MEIEKLNRKSAQKLIAVFLLTDGYLKYRKDRRQYILQIFSDDDEFHNCFADLMGYAFDKGTTFKHFDKSRRVKVSGYEIPHDSEIVKCLFSFCSDYRTGGNTDATLNFLMDEPESVKKLAFRIAMTAEGSIGISKSRSKRIEEPRLRFACAHPGLVKEWKNLIASLNITMNLDRDSANWSGIHGLITCKLENIVRFWKLGGFYPDIRIQSGKNIGFTKNEMLSAVIEWNKQGKKGKVKNHVGSYSLERG